MSLLNNLNSNKGFTIFEVLVAIFIIAMVFVAVPLSNPSNRRELETAIDDIDRAVRFATNEAVLRNAVTRLTIDVSKSPAEYFVEFSSDEGFLLPDPEQEKLVSTRKEEEGKQVKKSAIDRSFNKIPEFEEMKREISPIIITLGAYVGTGENLRKEGQISIYFYPSGERDGALILFGNDEEVAGLEILPFQQKTKSHFEPIFYEDYADIENQQNKAVKEIHSRWTK